MSSPWREAVCQSASVERIGDIGAFCQAGSAASESAIDRYYKDSRSIILFASQGLLSAHAWLGPTLSLSLVSCVENFFRNVMGDVINICPVSQKASAEKNINLGSMLWHSNKAERCAFEGTSFSNAKNIRSALRGFIGLSEKQVCELDDVLEEYEKVCQMRHVIAHSSGIVQGLNAIQLHIPRSHDEVFLKIDYANLHKIAAVCLSVVLAVNEMLFGVIAKRWAIDWRKESSWDVSRENELFRSLWSVFFSEVDKREGQISFSGTWVKCRNAVRLEYGL